MRWTAFALLPVLILLAAGCGTPSFLITPVSNSPQLQEVQVQSGQGFSPDKIALVEVEGMLVNARAGGLLQATENPLSKFTQQLNKAAADRRVKAVVLRINSPGGTVTASETMHRLVLEFRAATGKPVVAAAQETAASGGYMVALASDRIYANPTSVVGSIGVIFQTFHVQQTLGMIGVKVNTLTSGEMKDMGSPFRDPTEKDNAVMQGMIDSYYQRFVAKVTDRRGLGDPQRVTLVTDGRVFTGEQARSLGLVDEVGSLEEAIGAARAMANAPRAKVVMYIRPFGYTGSIYAQQALPPAQASAPLLSLPESVQPLAPGFYYLWRP
jgi:protease-4